MSKVYLFDWGDTLMVDFPNQSGKMCHWNEVQAVDGAKDMLRVLSQHHSVYVATNAADSSESDIKQAFERVGLDTYISGYFCKSNLGIGKGTAEFFHKIVRELGVDYDSVVMVGDSLDKDIDPAIKAGIEAIWFNHGDQRSEKIKVTEINHLSQLCS